MNIREQLIEMKKELIKAQEEKVKKGNKRAERGLKDHYEDISIIENAPQWLIDKYGEAALSGAGCTAPEFGWILDKAIYLRDHNTC